MSVDFHQLFRRRADLSPTEFNARFEAYAAEVRKLEHALGAVQITFAHEWGQAVNDRLALLRRTQEPFDGIVRMRLLEPDATLQRMQTPVVQRLVADLQHQQATFADLDRSVVFFSESDPCAMKAGFQTPSRRRAGSRCSRPLLRASRPAHRA